MDFKALTTEGVNPNTIDIDCVPTEEMIRMINEEDKTVAFAVEKEIPMIAKAVDLIVKKIQQGGRLIYMGAGTSGRIGVLDAAECPSTYGVDLSIVQALIAGGIEAIYLPRDGAEDLAGEGIADLKRIAFNGKDILVGIAASGKTPYVISGMEYARKLGASIIAVTCNPQSEMANRADISIAPVVGPEVIMGSTRMKAGTAQKMVVNMLSTGTMVKLGKVYKNLMIDVEASNEKLKNRCKRMVALAADVTEEEAERLLTETGYAAKLAVFMGLSRLPREQAEEVLRAHEGILWKALQK
ncbi:N-acetylmuramic acid 6-phosphate etherase [Geosporobacter ferrireducens]|uniref:N-acetylmuramic acid 6-phosphate etherase n=1 Tax=Geosporobacter ferrireducens TaxID=1424294 RepID=A0A1D8GIV3_9FIRM|nr:N-acetylmuramic acid 6-phosphate etherase [Geosporobacter ferrireducens]AOT70836.1 N-acetylmuramic acid 6-phosphate etherase [Geosporobacter ferrireducens]MTI53541.1 N-acetylmuramic acid 6-phosphate etherase [Geosporobacter ferrireducens]